MKKLNVLEKALSARTRDLEVIIKESLEASFSLVKMVQNDTENHSQRLSEFKNRLNLLEESLERKWQNEIEISSARNRESVVNLTKKMEQYDLSIKGLQNDITGFNKLVKSQQTEFLDRVKKSFDRHETSLETVKTDLHEQHDNIASFPKLAEDLPKNLDYRLREFETITKTNFEDSTKILKIVQDESYQLKKSLDIAINKLEQIQSAFAVELQKVEDGIKLSFENHNAYISVLRNDIQHLQEPFKRLDLRIEKLAGRVKGRNLWSLISLAGIAIIVIIVNFMFNQQAKNRSLVAQQAYQQLYSVTQGTSEALLETIAKSSEVVISKVEKAQRENLEKVKKINKELVDAVQQGDRKQLMAIHDSNERQLNLIESLLKKKRK